MADNPKLKTFIDAFCDLERLQSGAGLVATLEEEERKCHDRQSDLQKQMEEAWQVIKDKNRTEQDEDEAMAALTHAWNGKRAVKEEREALRKAKAEQMEKNSRAREEEKRQLRICANALLELNGAFREIISPEWHVTATERQAESPLDVGILIGDEPGPETPTEVCPEDMQESQAAEKEESTRVSLFQDDGTVDHESEPGSEPIDESIIIAQALNRIEQQERSLTTAVDGQQRPRSASTTEMDAPVGQQPMSESSDHGYEEEVGSRATSSRREAKRRREPASTEEGSNVQEKQKTKKRSRRTQSEMGKPEPVRRQLKSKVLVATKSITMEDLSTLGHRHHINKDSRGRFVIYRCDVCGVHFDTHQGALTHLSRAPQHSSLRKSEVAGLDENSLSAKAAASDMMAIEVLGCSETRMEAHNAALADDEQRGRYVRRNAVGSYKPVVEVCYDPRWPAILLPRDQEKNRPRWQPERSTDAENEDEAAAGDSGEGTKSSRFPTGLPVQSDIPQPKQERKIQGFTPGQVYWTKEHLLQRFRPAVALPYQNLSEIGLPEYDVSRYFDRMRVKYRYDEESGYARDHTNARNVVEGDKVFPLLFLDNREGKTEPEVVFSRISLVREFDRLDLKDYENDTTFERLFQYLDQDRLWFTASAAEAVSDRSPDAGRGPEVDDVGSIPEEPGPPTTPPSTTILISDDKDSDSLPDTATLIRTTPMKASARSRTKGFHDRSRLARRTKHPGHARKTPAAAASSATAADMAMNSPTRRAPQPST